MYLSLSGNAVFEETRKKNAPITENIQQMNFPEINTALYNFSPDEKISIIEHCFSANEYVMQWQINTECNLNCSYCHNFTKEKNHEHLPVDLITNCFNKTGKIWFINITGGEIFLYPYFVSLIEKLTINHFISLNTNLLSDNIEEFSKKINPEKTGGINASFHYSELCKTDSGINTFIKNFQLLQNANFNVETSIVAHPLIFDKLPDIITLLRSEGIDNIYIRSFIGEYNNKNYPGDYTKHETDYFKSLIVKKAFDFNIYNSRFKGRHCLAGIKYFFMKPDGDVFRCSSINKNFGNLFKGTFLPDRISPYCNSETCRCSFEGILCSKNIKESFWQKLK
jgi:MoaA/NifB/PqqE/SkfB family radical SAM enzyme